MASYNQKRNILEVGDEKCNKMLAILMWGYYYNEF